MSNAAQAFGWFISIIISTIYIDMFWICIPLEMYMAFHHVFLYLKDG